MSIEAINQVIWFIVILFLLPVDLWLISVLFTHWIDTSNWNHPSIERIIFSLNCAYAYLIIDVIVSVLVCFSLYCLTYSGETSNLSPATLLVRWGGIILVMLYCFFDFPIKPVVKLLWPILKKWQSCPNWIRRLNGIYASRVIDLLVPWRDGMKDAARWTGLCVLCGTVIPYLGILSVSWVLGYLKTTIGLSKVAETMFDLLASLSDWYGAIVILALMLNLLVHSFATLTIAEAFRREER